MFKDLTKEVPPIMNVLNIHENLLEVLLEMGNYADVQVIILFVPFLIISKFLTFIEVRFAFERYVSNKEIAIRHMA